MPGLGQTLSVSKTSRSSTGGKSSGRLGFKLYRYSEIVGRVKKAVVGKEDQLSLKAWSKKCHPRTDCSLKKEIENSITDYDKEKLKKSCKMSGGDESSALEITRSNDKRKRPRRRMRP
jgi:hypothetical protein